MFDDFKKYVSRNIGYENAKLNSDILKNHYLSYAVYINSIGFEETNDEETNDKDNIFKKSHFIFNDIRKKLNDSYIHIYPSTL